MDPAVASARWTWWPAAVTLLNVCVASGFSIAGLIQPSAVLPANAEPTLGSSIFALYAAARTLPLAVAVILAVYRGETRILFALALLAGVIQCLDGLIGLTEHDLGKSMGPFVLAAFQFLAASSLSRKLNREAYVRGR